MKCVTSAPRTDRERDSSASKSDWPRNVIGLFILGVLYTASPVSAGDVYPPAWPIRIAVIDYTHTVSSFDGKGPIQPILDAVNIQLSRDLWPAWGISAVLVLKDQPDADNWNLELWDHIDIQQYPAPLGYHTIGPNGKPLAKVGVIDAMLLSWASKVISHEVLEMLVNPYTDRRIVVPLPENEPGGRLYWLEICDPTDEYDRYEVNGYMVSDFVYPSFFSPAGKRPFNFRENLLQPLKPATRGHIFSQPFRYTEDLRMDIGLWAQDVMPAVESTLTRASGKDR